MLFVHASVQAVSALETAPPFHIKLIVMGVGARLYRDESMVVHIAMLRQWVTCLVKPLPTCVETRGI
jgi:hypothetical protein